MIPSQKNKKNIFSPQWSERIVNAVQRQTTATAAAVFGSTGVI